MALPLYGVDSIQRSSCHIEKEVAESLNTTLGSLYDRLNNADKEAKERQEAVRISCEALFKPLQDEELDFLAKDGTLLFTETLGARMDGYKKLTEFHRQKIEDLSKSWFQIQNEIHQIASTFLGEDGMAMLCSNSKFDVSELVKATQKGLVEELEGERKRLKGKVAAACAESAREMEMAEKELKLNEKNKFKKLERLLAEDD
ncbi:MAG: hypothetical protein Q9167_003736 [Letrouitia subvulpina]